MSARLNSKDLGLNKTSSTSKFDLGFLAKPVTSQVPLLSLKVYHVTIIFHQKNVNIQKLQKNARIKTLKLEIKTKPRKKCCIVIRVDFHTIVNCKKVFARSLPKKENIYFQVSAMILLIQLSKMLIFLPW